MTGTSGRSGPARGTAASSLRRVASCAALAALVAAAPLGARMRTATDEALARAAAAAVRGVVTEVVARRDPAVDVVYTHVTIAVTRAWGFPAVPPRVELKLLGGVAGGAALAVGGQAEFRPGEEVVTLLDVRPRDHSLSVAGLAFGKWTLAAARAVRASGIADLAGDPAPSDVAGVEALAALAGRVVPLPPDWRAPAVDPAVAPAAFESPAVALEAPAGGRWHDADWGAAIAVDSASTGHPLFPSGGFAQALRALGLWSASSPLRLQPGVLRAPRCFSSAEPADGRISITYDDPCGEIADTSPTLALGGVFFDPADVRVVHGVAYGRATRGVVVLDNVAAKFAGFSVGCYEEVIAHELGHAIGLPHTATTPSVMAPWLAPECVNRTASQPLQPADLAALAARYPMPVTEGPPGPVGGLTAFVAGTTVSLAWQPASGPAATTYHLHAGTVPGGSDVGIVPLAQPGYVATGVPRGVYYVRVIALNAQGASAPGSEVTVVVGDGLPGVPFGLMAAAGPAGAVRVLWQPPVAGAAPHAYALLVGTVPGQPTTRIPVVSTSLSATGVAAGTYYVRAVAMNAAGTGPVSPEIAVIVP